MNDRTHAPQPENQAASQQESLDFGQESMMSADMSSIQFAADPPDADDRRNIQEAANNSPHVQQLKAVQLFANQSPAVIAQRKKAEAIQRQQAESGPKTLMPPQNGG
ncbi:MAG: hypothetical protein AAF570_24865, partial [Bacteroidota bacterium]